MPDGAAGENVVDFLDVADSRNEQSINANQSASRLGGQVHVSGCRGLRIFKVGFDAFCAVRCSADGLGRWAAVKSITQDQLEQEAEMLGDLPESQQEAAALALLGDPLLARRAVDWLVEAFGLILIPHIATLVLPRTFKARSEDGVWVELPLSADPIFSQAIKLGAQLYHHGHRELFGKIALRSAMVAAVNNALNAGADVNGAVLGPPCMHGLPAKMYRIG